MPAAVDSGFLARAREEAEQDEVHSKIESYWPIPRHLLRALDEDDRLAMFAIADVLEEGGRISGWRPAASSGKWSREKWHTKESVFVNEDSLLDRERFGRMLRCRFSREAFKTMGIVDPHACILDVTPRLPSLLMALLASSYEI